MIRDIKIDVRKLIEKQREVEIEVTKMSAELLDDLRDKNWTTRTGRAEQGLNAVPFATDENAGIVFGGIVPYQPRLENWKPHIMPTGEDYVPTFKKRIIRVLE